MRRDLVLVSGPPGAGKSTLADGLGRRLSATVIDKDRIDEPFSPDDRGAHYTAHVEPKVLEVMLRLAEQNLRTTGRVILDAPFTHIVLATPHWLDRLDAIASHHDARFTVLELVLDEAPLRARIEARGLQRDRVKLTDEGWAHFRESDRLGASFPRPHVRLDARLAPDAILAEALAALA